MLYRRDFFALLLLSLLSPVNLLGQEGPAASVSVEVMSSLDNSHSDLTTSTVESQSAPPGTALRITVSDAIAMAERNNPRMREAEACSGSMANSSIST